MCGRLLQPRSPAVIDSFRGSDFGRHSLALELEKVRSDCITRTLSSLHARNIFSGNEVLRQRQMTMKCLIAFHLSYYGRTWISN